jgi:hypothetical protein
VSIISCIKEIAIWEEVLAATLTGIKTKRKFDRAACLMLIDEPLLN